MADAQAMTIPEQAIEAALDKWRDHEFDGTLDNPRMRAALTAAAPYMSGVKVKQLEWNEYNNGQGIPDRWDAEASNLVFYSIVTQHDGYRVVFDYLVVDSIGVLDSLEAAKAAAQADYEKRILSALETSSAREQALEEAETQGNLKQWNIQDHLKTPGSIAEYLQATLDEGGSELLINAVSDVIRALKSQPALREAGNE